MRPPASSVSLTHWCREWVAEIYRLNETRLKHYDPAIERQRPAFDAAQDVLKETLDGLFADAARELPGLPDQAREGKALRSLLNRHPQRKVIPLPLRIGDRHNRFAAMRAVFDGRYASSSEWMKTVIEP